MEAQFENVDKIFRDFIDFIDLVREETFHLTSQQRQIADGKAAPLCS